MKSLIKTSHDYQLELPNALLAPPLLLDLISLGRFLFLCFTLSRVSGDHLV